MDILKLLQDYNVEYVTEGHKHCTPGWVNMHCPWCEGSQNFHLGFNMNGEYFVCWRCGWHPVLDTVAKLLDVTRTQAQVIMREYGGGFVRLRQEDPVVKIRSKRFKFPSGTEPMTGQHKNYLRKRGFNPDELETLWGLQGTGPISLLDGINYSHRIIIPIYWEGVVASFQGRDITNKSERKYMACPEEREVFKHKHILYGHPSIFERWDRCICVEGVADVWRVGPYAVATFGTKYTEQQMRLLTRFKKVLIWFDDEKAAQDQAKKLSSELRFRGTAVRTICRPGDPGDSSPEVVSEILDALLS